MVARKVGRPSRASADQLTKHIIDGAMAMFLKDGFSVTTIDAIVVELAISKATFYSRFPSKAALLEKGLEVVGDRVVVEDPSYEDHSIPFERRLDLMSRHLLKIVLDPQTIAIDRLATAESYRFPQIGQIAHRNGTVRLIGVIRKFLDVAVERGEMAAVDTITLSELYCDILLAFTRRAAHELSQASCSEEAAQYLAKMNTLIFGPYITATEPTKRKRASR